MYSLDITSIRYTTSRYEHILVWYVCILNTARGRRYQRNAESSTTHTHALIPEPVPARSERARETRYRRNRGARRENTSTRENTARKTHPPIPNRHHRNSTESKTVHTHKQERVPASEVRTDLRRLARHAMIRRGHLDGERIHPHPGMPRGNQPKQTALALNIPGRWRTETREGSKYFIYRHSAGDDIRFRENAVTFPDGSTGRGLFAERDSGKNEYISTWVGEPLGTPGTRVTADLASGRTQAAANTGADTANDARNRGDTAKVNAELTGKGAIRALENIPKGAETCIAYGTEFWHNSGDIKSSKQGERKVQHTTPQRSTGDKILGIIAYSVEKTKTGMWVLFIEELIGTRRSRGRGLRLGRRLIKEAIREALSHGGVEEIHLVVRNTSQQVHAQDIYRELGISRQKQNATRNRVQMDKLAREEQYWVGKVEAATSSLGADQAGSTSGGRTTTRYNGLEATTAKEKANIRSEFEEIHTHRNGNKALWTEHDKTSIHVVIWEAEWEQQTETQQQTETPMGKEMGGDGTSTLGGWNHQETEAGPSREDRPQTPSTDAGEETTEDMAGQGQGREQAEPTEETATETPEGKEEGKKRRVRRTRTSKMNEEGKIACVDDHVSTHTMMVQGGGDRRTYRCGQCKRRFMQQDPSTLTDVRLRNPKWVDARAPELPEGGKTRTRDHKQARAGDVRMGLHNASSIASAQVRRQYVRKMVAGMTIFAACETGLHGLEEADAITEAEREPGIHATAITGGYVGTKSGIIVYIPKSDAIPEETICKRETGEPRLQILIVDAELNGEGMRIVVTHGDSNGNATKKLAFLAGVRRAVKRIEDADKDGKRPERKYIWMGDHNMVLYPEIDQGEGQPVNARATGGGGTGYTHRNRNGSDRCI